MTWLFIVLAMAVIALVAGVVTGRISGGMDAPEPSSPFRPLPSGAGPDDVDGLRFSPALRGYRMDEVDRVLDQVVVELRHRDGEIARLQAVLRGEPYPADSADSADLADLDPVTVAPEVLESPEPAHEDDADGAGVTAVDVASESPRL